MGYFSKMSGNEPVAPPADVTEEVSKIPPLDLKKEFRAPSLEEWRGVVDKDLKGADFERKLVWKTLEGIDVQPLYTREDLKSVKHLNGLPGFAPYTRGTQPLSGVAHHWQIRQDSMLAAPEEVNAAVHDGLARGQTAIGIRLDNAARQGYDGDSAEARELAGRGGCTMSSVNGLRIALAEIDLTRYPITIRTGTAALPVLAMLVALADEQKVDRKTLVGAVECDPFRDLVKSGALRGPLSLHYREMADIVKFCAAQCPGIRGVMVNSSPYHNAGASIVQELAFTLAGAIEYIRALEERGVDIDTAALHIMFSFSASTNTFMEIAKLRAARTLWAKIVKSFGSTNESAAKMFMHVRTSSHTMTVHDPYNNMLRTAMESFAAAVGGCDSMYVAPFTEAIGRPDDFARRMARNQQIILQEESYLSRVVDPGAGSYYIESLTESIGQEVWKLIQRIEGEGGLHKALEKGTVQEQTESVAAKRRQMIAQRRVPIVGVSNYAKPDEELLERRYVPRDEFLAERRRRLARLKSMRKNSDVRAKLNGLTQGVYTEGSNLVETAIEAAREGATIGEIIHALNQGAEAPAEKVAPMRAERQSLPFEVLRARAQAWTSKHGEPPKVFFVPTGKPVMRRARVEFSHGFFGAGGFLTVEPEPFDNMDDAAKAIIDSTISAVVVCADDESYPNVVPELVKKVKEQRSHVHLYVAGYPKDSIDMLRDAGVDGFIHIKSNVIEELTALQEKLGIGKDVYIDLMSPMSGVVPRLKVTPGEGR